MKKQFSIILSIILVIFIVVVALSNVQTAEVNLIFTKVRMPLIVLILVCLLIGALIMFLMNTAAIMRKNSEIKQLQSEKRRFENDLNKVSDGEKK